MRPASPSKLGFLGGIAPDVPAVPIAGLAAPPVLIVAPTVVPTVPVAGTADVSAPVQVAQTAPVVAEPVLSAPTCPMDVVPVAPTIPVGWKSPIVGSDRSKIEPGLLIEVELVC